MNFQLLTCLAMYFLATPLQKASYIFLVSTKMLLTGCLVASSFGTSMSLSPLLTWFCQRRSARLTGCVGGISLALGGLFTSFATQFHHMFFSYGIMTGNVLQRRPPCGLTIQHFASGLGVGMVRDSATIMLNQYFKRRRALVEVFFAMGNGVGILLTSPVIFSLLR